MRRTGTIALLVVALVSLTGCVETPRQPVMRPIPPPPPGPPPGAAVVIYAPPVMVTNMPVPVAGVVTNGVTGPGNFEVSSNFVASAPQPGNAAVQVQGGTTSQGTPQYEIVPPRPGPDFVWHDGFWRWEGTWVWIPGQWEPYPPAVIHVEPGFSYHYHMGPWRPGHGRYRRWR